MAMMLGRLSNKLKGSAKGTSSSYSRERVERYFSLSFRVLMI
jgi:hypothetical protein